MPRSWDGKPSRLAHLAHDFTKLSRSWPAVGCQKKLRTPSRVPPIPGWAANARSSWNCFSISCLESFRERKHSNPPSCARIRIRSLLDIFCLNKIATFALSSFLSSLPSLLQRHRVSRTSAHSVHYLAQILLLVPRVIFSPLLAPGNNPNEVWSARTLPHSAALTCTPRRYQSPRSGLANTQPQINLVLLQNAA